MLYLEKLIKHSDYRRTDELRGEAKVELARLFGVEHDFFKRIMGKEKSPSLTKEQIATVLLNNELVNNLEEGLKETEELLRVGIGYTAFHEYKNKDLELRYRLEYIGPPLD